MKLNGLVSRNLEVVFLLFTKIECIGTVLKFSAGFSCHNITERLTFRQEKNGQKLSPMEHVPKDCILDVQPNCRPN